MIKNLLCLLALAVSISATAQTNVFTRTIKGTGGTRTDTLDDNSVVVLELSTDDVEQENDEVDSRYDDDLDCGWEGDPEDQNMLHMGLRFQDIFIPQGAKVKSAHIVFHAHEGKSAEDVAKLTIWGEAADNAPTFDEANFNENYLLTDRPTTTASVEWTVAEEWIIWQPYQTADITSIVQEILDRDGWASGNSMAFIFKAEDQGPSVVENAREFTSFENIADPDDVDPEGNPGDGKNHPERRPYIVITLEEPLSAEAPESNTLNVYPNPVTNNELSINFTEAAPAAVVIYNTNGQVVREFTSNEMNPTFDLNGLAPQLYMLRVTQNGKSFEKRIVVE
jgi:hypothetical protein